MKKRFLIVSLMKELLNLPTVTKKQKTKLTTSCFAT